MERTHLRFRLMFDADNLDKRAKHLCYMSTHGNKPVFTLANKNM